VNIITRKINGVTTECPVYTIAEATERSIKFVPWKQGFDLKLRTGDWVSSDDGYVVQLRRDVGAWMYTTISVLSFRSGHFRAETRIANKSYNTISDKGSFDLAISGIRFKNVLRAVALANIEHRTPDWEALGKYLRPTSKIPEASAKIYFKSKKVQNMLKEEVSKILTDEGLSPQMAARGIKLAMELAIEKKNPKMLLEAADRITELFDMHPKKVSTQLGQYMQFDPMGTMADPATLKQLEDARAQVAAEPDDSLDMVRGDEDQEYVIPEKYMAEKGIMPQATNLG
jgi:hypothetical protein